MLKFVKTALLSTRVRTVPDNGRSRRLLSIMSGKDEGKTPVPAESEESLSASASGGNELEVKGKDARSPEAKVETGGAVEAGGVKGNEGQKTRKGADEGVKGGQVTQKGGGSQQKGGRGGGVGGGGGGRGMGFLSRFFSQGPQRDRKYYESLSLDEKRQQYKCKSRYVTLDDIETWEDTRNTVRKNNTQMSQSTYSPAPLLDSKVSLWRGDITRLEIDAIVNAANSSLLGGGGVDGAIHNAAGSSLYDECLGLDGCDTGKTKITSGHRLPAKYILHTVGPTNRSEKMLSGCYDSCFKLVQENNIKSLAFCCIATGIYGYPNEKAADVALRITRKWLESNADQIDRIIFCVFLEKDLKIYRQKLHHYFPGEGRREKAGSTPPAEHAKEEEAQGNGNTETEDKDVLKPSMVRSVTEPVPRLADTRAAGDEHESMETEVTEDVKHHDTTGTHDDTGDTVDMKCDTGDAGNAKCDTSDTGDMKCDTGDAKSDTGDTGDAKSDTGDAKSDTGDTGNAKCDTGGTGNAKSDTGDTGDMKCDTRDAKSDTGDTGDMKCDTGDAGDAKCDTDDTGDMKCDTGDAGDAKCDTGGTGGAKCDIGDTGDMKCDTGDTGDTKSDTGDIIVDMDVGGGE